MEHSLLGGVLGLDYCRKGCSSHHWKAPGGISCVDGASPPANLPFPAKVCSLEGGLENPPLRLNNMHGDGRGAQESGSVV